MGGGKRVWQTSIAIPVSTVCRRRYNQNTPRQISRDVTKANGERFDYLVNQAAISCGYEEQKPEQASISIKFVCGNDVFGCLQTGFGKSVCFMLLPMIFDAVKARALGESIVIVVSSLTSLMHDQVSNCRTED